jgi:hypothetical protein
MKLQKSMVKLKFVKMVIITMLTASSLLKAEDAGKSMCHIPAGVQPRSDGQSAKIASFSLSALECTHGEWSAVRVWALTKGYDFGQGVAETSKHPVSCISWYDSVKFCNAASERVGRSPVYRAGNEVYRTGMSDNVTADWAANGYRLPTEAEWEYACRADTTTKYYWGDESVASPENPYAWHTIFDAHGEEVSPHPVGLKKPNAFGLFDMSGNVAEWCWDWFALECDAKALDHREGPAQGRWRVLRGGSVALDNFIDSGYRHFVCPFFTMYDLGFRVASSDPHCPAIAVEPQAKPAAIERSMITPDAKATAEKLFALVDLSLPGLEPVAAHLKAGRFSEALSAYRDFFFAAQRAIPLQSIYRADGFGARGKPEEIEKLMAIQGRVPWYFPLQPGGTSYNTGLLKEDVKKLLKEWETGKDPLPLRQWFHIVAEFALHAKNDFTALDTAGRAAMNNYNVPLTWDWGMGFNDYSSPLREIQKVVHALPPDGAAQLPPLELAQILAFITTDSVSVTLKDPRDCAPNQSFCNAQVLINLGHKLSEFRDAAAWSEEGKRRLLYSATRTVLADGGDLEQSFNYNGDMPRKVHDLAVMFGDDQPAWVRALHPIGLARLRLFAGLTQPIGGLPSSGSVNANFAPGAICRDAKTLEAHKTRQLDTTAEDLKKYPDPLCASIYNALFGAVNQPAPSFTSIAYPYSGYYVLRDGWDVMSRYLWFMAARPGSGHSVENINSFELVAFGRTFLTSGGAGSYGNPSFVEKEQLPFIPQIDAYRDRSQSRNTVMVDGKSQSRGISGRFVRTTPYADAIAQRWHSSAHFDLVDGVYNDGYGDKSGPTVAVEHRRSIVFVRAAGLWLVTDRMKAQASHAYSAVWNIMPVVSTRNGDTAGFSDEQVVVDAAAQMISTRDPGGANLFLYQAATVPVTYERFCGQLNPARGWLAPGLIGHRYAKTDVWSSWKGAAGVSQLVTAICPAPAAESAITATENLSKGAMVGIKLTLRDGGTVLWQSAPELVALSGGSVAVTAEMLLVVTDASGGVRGLTIGCREMTLAGKVQKVRGPDFEFAVEGQRLADVQPIRVPDGFAWKETPTGIVPVYH